MPIEVPQLDDRTFQQLVDEAKRRIPQFCPGWTDHNVSDPGITLIELFAYMTEQYLYRLNQVPEKNYVAFLNLLGVSFKPPRAARGAVTFTLTRPPTSAPSEKPITIQAGTEVATSRSMAEEAIVFTTDHEVPALPPTLKAILTQEKSDAPWGPHLPLPSLAWPGATPATDKAALALGFDHDLSAHTLAIIFEYTSDKDWSCDWQVYRRPTAYDKEPWPSLGKSLQVKNGAEAPRKGGEIELYLPNNCQGTTLGNTEARTWVRCVPTANASPMILSVRAETRGITVPVTHAQVIENEVMGTSDGQPGQSFSLLHHPILEPGDPDEGDDANPHPDEWVVEVGAEGNWQAWRRERYFSQAVKPDERIYLIDPMNGIVRFAPEIRQADGRVIRPGAIPEHGLKIRIRRYRIGGGKQGNVKAEQINVIKQSLTDIKDATNRLRTWGGRAAQTLEDAKQWGLAPARELERLRAVTAEDFEILAQGVPGVGRAHCLTPTDQPGNVKLLVIPDLPFLDSDQALDDYIQKRESWRPNLGSLDYSPNQALQELAVPPETKERLHIAMKPRLLLGTDMHPEEPEYIWVRVEIYIRVSPLAIPDTVIQMVKRKLYLWFHPLFGGADGKGWGLGERLKEDKLWMLIGSTAGVEEISGISLYEFKADDHDHFHSWTPHNILTDDHGNSLDRPITFPPLDTSFNGIISAVYHDVKLSLKSDEHVAGSAHR